MMGPAWHVVLGECQKGRFDFLNRYGISEKNHAATVVQLIFGLYAR